MKVLTDPKVMMWVNGVLAIFFAILIIPAWIFGWISSTEFISILSIWALVASHWAAWQAGHAEKKQDQSNTQE